MPLKKQIESLKIAVLLPAYRRIEYTRKCLSALEGAQTYKNVDFFLIDDGSGDDTAELMASSSLKKQVFKNERNVGLREVILDFFDLTGSYDILVKIDNDCSVPVNWINDLIKIFETSDVDILSPNVYPSNAAFTYGKQDTENKGYRPAEIVGGLWLMKRELVDNVVFERHPTVALVGAISILKQLVTELTPNVGWAADVIVQDIGHWSGKHPEHLKTVDHENYSKSVGRQIAWRAI